MPLVGSGPDPGEKFVEPAVRPEIDEAGEHVCEIGFRIDAVQLAGLDQRSDDGPVLGAVIVAGEESVLSGKGNHPFILPMSGKSWKSNIGGTRISAARFPCVAWSSERRANF